MRRAGMPTLAVTLCLRSKGSISRRSAVGLLGLVLLFHGASLDAAALYLAPSGSEPLSMAGAFVAGSNGVLSLSYNPAGLRARRGSTDDALELHMDGVYASYQTTFQRRRPDGTFYPLVEGQGMG